LLQNDSVFGKNTGLFIMDESTAFDVDSELDFKIVEFLIKEKNLQAKDF
ncbi:UNVERIFIED_CONTAM: flagellar modification protein B, partial [Campylobacter jejuni]